MDVFFFFKQKTAYEMRISDWSSDVCSSDLRAIAVMAHRGHEEFLADREGRRQRVEKGGAAGIAAVPPAPRRGASSEFPIALVDRQIGGSRGGGWHPIAPFVSEFGRASVRERGCQSV